MLLAPRQNVGFAGFHVGLADDVGFDFLAHFFVWHTDHGHHRNHWMRHQHFFQLTRIHVVAAAQNHILDPIHNRQIAFVVKDADVAGVEPAVSHGFGGRIGAFIVALHNVVAANHDLAFFARCHWLIVRVHTGNVHAPQWLADSTGLGRQINMVERCNWRRFRQAVAFQNANAKHLLELFHHFHRHGCAA